MKNQQRKVRRNYNPQRKCPDSDQVATSISRGARGRYIAYPKALDALSKRLGATAEELAGWIFMGEKHGGLAAYTNANELDPPPRFYFDCFMGQDYLSPMMACWFRSEDIDCFNPADRFITGKALLERWSNRLGIQPEAFIRAKIAESRLHDLHPTCGLTQGTNPEDPSLPPMTSALFSLMDVEDIEARDFGLNTKNETREQRRKRLAFLVHDEKLRGNKAFLKTVAAKEGISITRLKQLLAGTSKLQPAHNTWAPLATPSRQTNSTKKKSVR